LAAAQLRLSLFAKVSMYDSSSIPIVDDLGLEQPGEIAYAAQMAARENALHAIFGPTDPPDQILSPGDPNLFINWSGGGIYQYPPNGNRKSWHYVTSGLSQPHIDDDANPEPVIDEDGERYSGFGIELVISTIEKVAWAPNVLVNLVKYLLFQENARVILPGDRIPCNGPLVLETTTPLRYLVATTSSEYESQILLPVGHCHLVHLIGCTQGEIDAALTMGHGTAGSIVLCRLLRDMGIGFDSIPERSCVTDDQSFAATWDRVRSTCELE
jgi:hypothetical protein